MSTEWPLVLADDDGIRPAGNPYACFYCRQSVGEPHGLDCVIVGKRVLVRYTIEVPVVIPHHWTADDLAFHREDSSSCANNIIEWDFAKAVGEYGCLCAFLKRAELVEVLDPTPIRRTKAEREKEDKLVRRWGSEDEDES